jgi:YfiH family protein
MNKDNRDSHLIFFGNKEESLFLSDIKESRFSFELQMIVQDHGLQKFVALDQVHGAQGLVVDENTFLLSGSQIKFGMTYEEKKISPLVIPGLNGDPDIKKKSFQAKWFNHQGDFLITNQKNIGLVVLTADCTPLVLYDSASHAIGLVHAGWKGSYLGVLEETLQAMQKNYGTDFKNLKCSFGPSAKSCCYEVSESFVRDFEKKYSDAVIPAFERESKSLEVFSQTNSRYYFDNSLFLQQLLKKFGIESQNIYTDNALCTICNPQFCSFRKEKERANRQITMVALL